MLTPPPRPTLFPYTTLFRSLATLKTTRTGRLVDGIEVTLDQVEVLEGQHVLDRFAEIEAELVTEDGDLPRVDRLLLERSEEHTSELQSLTNLVCRLLLEKKK